MDNIFYPKLKILDFIPLYFSSFPATIFLSGRIQLHDHNECGNIAFDEVMH